MGNRAYNCFVEVFNRLYEVALSEHYVDTLRDVYSNNLRLQRANPQMEMTDASIRLAREMARLDPELLFEWSEVVNAPLRDNDRVLYSDATQSGFV